MNISFIGAGKVGTSFGIYLKQKGINITGYFSENFKDAQLASDKTKSIAYESLKDLVKDSQVIFITTNDDSIKNIKDKLIDESKNDLNQKIISHVSGSYSSNILSDLKKYNAYVYSTHPLQSFADIDSSVEKLYNTVFTIEGCGENISVLENLLDKTNNKYFKIDTNYKELYHVGACVVSNYLVTLIDLGLSFLEQVGIDKKDGIEAISPLIDGTIENIKTFGTKKALTGPISRGDVKTIKSHLESINTNTPDKLLFYKTMALMTLDISLNSPSQTNIEEIKNILKGED